MGVMHRAYLHTIMGLPRGSRADTQKVANGQPVKVEFHLKVKGRIVSDKKHTKCINLAAAFILDRAPSAGFIPYNS